MNINDIYQGQVERVKRGEIDHADYRATCPFRSAVCRATPCERCRYFVPPVEKPDPACKFCDARRPSIEVREVWRNAVRLPTEDGLHESYEGGDKLFERYECRECKRFTDIEITEDKEEGVRIPAVYASEIREMHSDLEKRLSLIEAIVGENHELIYRMLALRELETLTPTMENEGDGD